MEVTAIIIGIEPHHQTAGIGPGLRPEVAQVSNLDAGFLGYLTVYSLLQGLTCLDKTRYKTIEVGLEIAGMNQQDFIATVYEDNDGRCQLFTAKVYFSFAVTFNILH